MTNDDVQAIQIGRLGSHGLQCLIAGIDEGRAQEQVFGGVAAQGQLGREQQGHTGPVRITGSLDNAAGIALQVTHDEIELGGADDKGHGEGGRKGNGEMSRGMPAADYR